MVLVTFSIAEQHIDTNKLKGRVDLFFCVEVTCGLTFPTDSRAEKQPTDIDTNKLETQPNDIDTNKFETQIIFLIFLSQFPSFGNLSFFSISLIVNILHSAAYSLSMPIGGCWRTPSVCPMVDEGKKRFRNTLRGLPIPAIACGNLPLRSWHLSSSMSHP